MTQTKSLTVNFRKSVLERFYSQPTIFGAAPANKYYHNYTHILSGYYIAETFGWELTPAQELAWLFHDSVYVPGSTTNEIMSVKRMRYSVGETYDYKYQCFVDPAISESKEKIKDILNRAEQIILDTITHFPSTEESERVLDLDLFGLGGPEFISNGVQIFNEYKPLLVLEHDDYEAAFTAGRSAWAKKFLERSRIYRTPECEYREDTARKNLQSLIKDNDG